MRPRTIVIIVVLCGGAFLALACACGGFFIYSWRHTDAEIAPKVDRLFAAMDDGTFGDTYLTYTTPEFRTVTSRAQYEQIGVLVKSGLGRLRSKSLQQFSYQQFNTQRTANLVYTGEFEKGSATIRLRLVSRGGDWQVLALFVESPELMKPPPSKKCGNCGESHPLGVRFCPHCGKAASSEPAPAQPEAEARNAESEPEA